MHGFRIYTSYRSKNSIYLQSSHSPVLVLVTAHCDTSVWWHTSGYTLHALHEFISAFSSTDNWRRLILHGVKSTGKEIRRGTYGRVFEVEYEKTHCAAKEVHVLLLEYAQHDQTAFQNIKDSFFNECHIWSLLHGAPTHRYQ